MISKRLTSFIAVVEEGSMTRAAERLFTTLPPLSRQIKLLEEELGYSLLERNHLGVKLTCRGAAFYDEVLPAFNILKRLKNRSADQECLEIEMFSIPPMHSFALTSYLISKGVTRFNLKETDVASNRADMIIAAENHPHQKYSLLTSVHSRMKLICCQASQQTSYTSVQHAPIIQCSKVYNHQAFQPYLSQLRNEGFAGDIIINDNNFSRLKLVSEGHAITLAPSEIFMNNLSNEFSDFDFVDAIPFEMAYFIYYHSAAHSRWETVLSFYRDMDAINGTP
jgi:DNA-binding transcriptional LysR family regulator